MGVIRCVIVLFVQICGSLSYEYKMGDELTVSSHFFFSFSMMSFFFQSGTPSHLACSARSASTTCYKGEIIEYSWSYWIQFYILEILYGDCASLYIPFLMILFYLIMGKLQNYDQSLANLLPDGWSIKLQHQQITNNYDNKLLK